MEKKRLLRLTLLLLFPTLPLFGQTSDTLSPQAIREIIVSAARHEQNAAETTRSTTVLGPAALGQTVFTNVGEILARQYGAYVTGAGQTPGQLQTLFLRGAAGNQTAILVDGIRLYEPSAPEAAADLSEWSLADVERIEIVRGSHSALYGSGAVGGVVNIVTKQAGKTGFSGTVEGRAGAFGPKTLLSGGDAAIRYTHAKGFYAGAGVHYDFSKGLDATVDSSTQANALPRDRDGFEKTDVFGKVGFRNARWQASANYRSARQTADIDDGAFRDDVNHRSGQQRQVLQYGLQRQLGSKYRLSFQAGWTQMVRKVQDDSSLIAPGLSDRTFFKGDYNGNTLTHELQGSRQAQFTRFTLGLFHFQETMSAHTDLYSNSDFGPFSQQTNLDSLHLKTNTAGAFAQAEWQGRALGAALERLRLNADLRVARHSAFGNVLTFNLNPSLRLFSHTLLFAAYTTGFNAPSLYQLYTPEADFVSGITRGNPGLKAEYSSALELGIKRQGPRWDWHVSLFYNTIENSIQYVYLWAAGKPTDQLGFADYRGDTYLNLGQQRVGGLECSMAYRFSDRLRAGGNLTLLRGNLHLPGEVAADPHLAGLQPQLYNSGRFVGRAGQIDGLVRRPNTANLYAEWQCLRSLALRADVRYAGARADVFYDFGLGPFGALTAADVNAYWLADLSVRWQLSKQIQLKLRIENLLDEQYQEIWGYTTRGRSIFAALRCSF